MTDRHPTCLFINNSPQPGRKHLAKLGGGGKSLLSLLSKLQDFNWSAHVVVPGEGQFTDALVEMGIPHSIFPFRPLDLSRPFQAIRTTRHWQRLLTAIRPHLIHANGFDLGRSFALAARMLNIPYLTHVRFPVDPNGARWVLRGLPKPAAFIFNSQAMQEKLWPDIGRLATRSRPFVAHNAIDLESFSPAPWPTAPQCRIGIIANFAAFKRHEDFLRMAAEMLKARQDLEFWVVGDDTEGRQRMAALKNLADDLGVTPHVRFLGHRSDVPDILRQLHLLVVPSQFEPFGRVVIEAMACGRPVIGSRDGGIPEIIRDGETGYLVPVGDYRWFAMKALEVLNQRALWERMSAAAAADARARFSTVRHTSQIVDIYGAVLSGAKPPSGLS